jgi:phage host-nuclease inhibitor protein Gam
MSEDFERTFSYRGMFLQIGAMEKELKELKVEAKSKKSLGDKELSEKIEILKEKIKSLKESTMQAIKDKTGR